MWQWIEQFCILLSYYYFKPSWKLIRNLIRLESWYIAIEYFHHLFSFKCDLMTLLERINFLVHLGRCVIFHSFIDFSVAFNFLRFFSLFLTWTYITQYNRQYYYPVKWFKELKFKLNWYSGAPHIPPGPMVPWLLVS